MPPMLLKLAPGKMRTYVLKPYVGTLVTGNVLVLALGQWNTSSEDLSVAPVGKHALCRTKMSLTA